MQKQNSIPDKIIRKDNVVTELFGDDLIVQSYVYSYKSKKYWVIRKPITVELSDGTIITIPDGFFYDMASVPKFLWSIARPFNDGLFGTLIHDYLYHIKIKSRKETDKEYLYWNKITNSNIIDNYVRYFFVRAFGWLYWNRII
jgi:hypothetical protein